MCVKSQCSSWSQFFITIWFLTFYHLKWAASLFYSHSFCCWTFNFSSRKLNFTESFRFIYRQKTAVVYLITDVMWLPHCFPVSKRPKVQKWNEERETVPCLLKTCSGSFVALNFHITQTLVWWQHSKNQQHVRTIHLLIEDRALWRVLKGEDVCDITALRRGNCWLFSVCQCVSTVCVCSPEMTKLSN